MHLPNSHGVSLKIILQGALKGTNLRGQNRAQTQIFADSRRFSLIFAFSWKTEYLGNVDFRRKPQKTAGARRKPQIGVCPFRFVPLCAALILGAALCQTRFIFFLRPGLRFRQKFLLRSLVAYYLAIFDPISCDTPIARYLQDTRRFLRLTEPHVLQ